MKSGQSYSVFTDSEDEDYSFYTEDSNLLGASSLFSKPGDSNKSASSSAANTTLTRPSKNNIQSNVFGGETRITIDEDNQAKKPRSTNKLKLCTLL